MGYSLLQADGFRTDLDQTLVVDDWAIEFLDEDGGVLDGSIDFHVDGRHFPFVGVMTFMRDVFPQSDLNCP